MHNKNVIFEETRTIFLSNLELTFIYTPPPYMSHLGTTRLWKEARLLVLPTYWARAQRVKKAIYGWGMGRFFASPQRIGQNWDSK